MRVAFCVTCKGRAPHLELTLPANLADNASSDAVMVVVDYNSKDHLESFLKTRRRDIDSGRLVTYRFTEPTPFRMAHAKNLAHRLGMAEGAEVLVNIDADNYTGPGFGDYISDQFEVSSNIFMWSKMIKGALDRGISGRIAVTKDAFVCAGGYDENYTTHSPDDKDFNLRLRKLGYKACEIDQQFLRAVRHNDKIRFREYPHARELMVEDFSINPPCAVVNGGNFGCGVIYKNFDPYPYELGPLPSRIFGIGMHKTGTTSLHQALKILGCRSAHWKSASWAKSIWVEMKMKGRSPTLEKHYALSDIPIGMLYKELDLAYPGSKFILTVRSEQDWLASVQNHWSSTNPWRQEWEHDGFSNDIHQALYGRQSFDAEVFLARYRQHNQEVREYFKGRPQDLLVMNMTEGAGWYELCGFLRRTVPSVAYPRRNATQDLAAAAAAGDE